MPRTKIVGRVCPFFESNEYFTVEVVADSATLQKFLTDETFSDGEEGEAVFIPCNGKFKLGRMVFIKSAMNMGLVIHESLHAAMHVLRIFFEDVDSWNGEELAAIFVECLSTQAIKVLKDAKMLTGDETNVVFRNV